MSVTMKTYQPVPSPLKWHGGKGGYHGKLAQWIISLMPDHVHYVEPFFGGGSVLLYKDPEGVSEVVNDIHRDLVGFWRVMQSPSGFEEFRRQVEAVPFCQDEFREWFARGGNDWERWPVQSTVGFFIHCRQSLAGRIGKKATFAPLSKSRTRRGMNEQVSAWLTTIEGLPEVHARLKRVVILNDKACRVIQSEDSPTTCFYLDPPYLHETRATTGEYQHEMSDAEHAGMLGLLVGIKGKFLLSGYHSSLYDGIAARAGWTCHEFKIPNSAAGGKKKREMVECVYTNF